MVISWWWHGFQMVNHHITQWLTLIQTWLTMFQLCSQQLGYTLLWQFFNTSKFKRNTYYLLWYSNTFLQDRFKIRRALPQLQKNCETFYRSNSRWKNVYFDTEKKLTSGMVLQKLILVNLRCRYKDTLKKTVFRML